MFFQYHRVNVLLGQSCHSCLFGGGFNGAIYGFSIFSRCVSKFSHTLCLAGDAQYFFDASLPAQGFDESVQLHCYHALTDSCFLYLITGTIGYDLFLD